jgi:hypothetical protein
VTRGRKEIPPDEQLWGLRKARDRYQALADQVRDDVDLLQQPEEKLARERDARRIAHAYEKSVQNMITSCRIRQIDMQASESGSVAAKVAMVAFFIAAAGAGFVAVARPSVPQAMLARITGADAAAPIAKSRRPVADTAVQAPVPSKPAPEPSAMPVPNIQPAKNRHSVVRTGPVTPAAKRASRQRQPVKAIGGAADGGSHFVVKVIQPDGTLKEQSFPSAPSH